MWTCKPPLCVWTTTTTTKCLSSISKTVGEIAEKKHNLFIQLEFKENIQSQTTFFRILKKKSKPCGYAHLN